MTLSPVKQLVEAETRRVVVARLEIADTLWKGTLGLMGRSKLATDGGLWLEPCSGIHTFFLRFPIDVLFLDRNGKAVRLVPNLRPWRIYGLARSARVCVELPVGTLAAQGIQAGRRYVAEDREQG